MSEDNSLNTTETNTNDTGENLYQDLKTDQPEATDQPAQVEEVVEEPATRGEINRLYAENRKLKKSNETTTEEPNDQTDPNVREVVREELKGMTQHLREQQDEVEIKNFFDSNPAYGEHEAKARKYWNHESRRHLPFSTVALEAIGMDNIMKAGADQAKQANDDAGKFNTTGRTSRKVDIKQDWMGMSNEDFAKARNEGMNRR